MKREKKKCCPRCHQPVVWEKNLYRPFCSERCKLLDLGKWASDEYRIEGEKVSDPKDSEEDD